MNQMPRYVQDLGRSVSYLTSTEWLIRSWNTGTVDEAIARATADALVRYRAMFGGLDVPMRLSWLARVFRVELRPASRSCGRWCRLIPKREGFVARYRVDRQRYGRDLGICHEFAHTYFYDLCGPVPRWPPGLPTSEEEALCDRIARRPLVPTQTLKHVHRGVAHMHLIDQIMRLASTFQVPFQIVATRMVKDESLSAQNVMVVIHQLSRDWKQVVLGRLAPSRYFRSMIFKRLKDEEKAGLSTGERHPFDWELGVRKQFTCVGEMIPYTYGEARATLSVIHITPFVQTSAT